MNKETRQRLEELHCRLMEVSYELNEIAEAEQEKFDNAPENLQESERVQMWQECAEAITSICDDIDSAADELQDDVISVY